MGQAGEGARNRYVRSERNAQLGSRSSFASLHRGGFTGKYECEREREREREQSTRRARIIRQASAAQLPQLPTASCTPGPWPRPPRGRHLLCPHLPCLMQGWRAVPRLRQRRLKPRHASSPTLATILYASLAMAPLASSYSRRRCANPHSALCTHIFACCACRLRHHRLTPLACLMLPCPAVSAASSSTVQRSLRQRTCFVKHTLAAHIHASLVI